MTDHPSCRRRSFFFFYDGYLGIFISIISIVLMGGAKPSRHCNFFGTGFVWNHIMFRFCGREILCAQWCLYSQLFHIRYRTSHTQTEDPGPGAHIDTHSSSHWSNRVLLVRLLWIVVFQHRQWQFVNGRITWCVLVHRRPVWQSPPLPAPARLRVIIGQCTRQVVGSVLHKTSHNVAQLIPWVTSRWACVCRRWEAEIILWHTIAMPTVLWKSVGTMTICAPPLHHHVLLFHLIPARMDSEHIHWYQIPDRRPSRWIIDCWCWCQLCLHPKCTCHYSHRLPARPHLHPIITNSFLIPICKAFTYVISITTRLQRLEGIGHKKCDPTCCLLITFW